jgi:hypothetical protein
MANIPTTPASNIPHLWRNTRWQLEDEIVLRYIRHRRAFRWAWHAREDSIRHRRACDVMRQHARWLDAAMEHLYDGMPAVCAEGIVERLIARGAVGAVPPKLWTDEYRAEQSRESFRQQVLALEAELPRLV